MLGPNFLLSSEPRTQWWERNLKRHLPPEFSRRRCSQCTKGPTHSKRAPTAAVTSWLPHTGAACSEVLLGRKERSPLTETTESKWYSECPHSPDVTGSNYTATPSPLSSCDSTSGKCSQMRRKLTQASEEPGPGRGWRRGYAQESATQTRKTRQTFKMPHWDLSSNWFSPTDLGRSDASRSWGGKGLGQFSTLTNNSGYKVRPSGLGNMISHERKGLAFT